MPRIKYYNTTTEQWEYADRVIMGSEGPKNVISFEEQALNDEQKLQARTNIGAVSGEEVNTAIENALGSGAGGVLRTSDVVNNLQSENIDKPLSANQGKILNTQLNQVRENIQSIQDTTNQLEESLSNLEFAPLYEYSDIDLVPGTSPLESGKLYFVYE